MVILILIAAIGAPIVLVTLLGSWVIVHPFEEVVVVSWGRLAGVIRQPGLHWATIWGRRLQRVRTAQQTIVLPKNTVADGNGNPIVVSGIVTFAFQDAAKAALEVRDAHDFVRSQAQAVLKQIASRYPYEARSSGGDAVEGHSLKTEAGLIGPELVRTLQAKVAPAGAKVASFELSDLAYAPEIAPSMLIRQQAQALVDARKTIVEGAVEIVREAVELLDRKGLGVAGPERARLVTNLLTVICGEAKVQPVVSVSTNDRESQGDATARAVEDLAASIGRIGTRLGLSEEVLHATTG
jgi:regulator of protease activity HflC (stomatin/prohibitin superfamily)